MSVYRISKKNEDLYSGAVIGGVISEYEAFQIFNTKCNFGDNNLMNNFDIEKFDSVDDALLKIDAPILAPKYKKMGRKSTEAKFLILQWFKGWNK